MIDSDEAIRKRLKHMLSDLADTNSGAKHSAATVDLDQSRVGRLSRMDALQNQAISQSARAQRSVQIEDTKAALTRLEQGVYGLCEVCDQKINPRRLEYFPAARLCIECAEKEEQ